MKRFLSVWKKIFSLVPVLCAAFAFCPKVSALPGIKSPVADRSGDFVFYRDLTFKSDAVVGFAYYDDTSYAIRFYSEGSGKDITLYVSVDPENPSPEFTGETIKGFTVQEDADIVNYLHDLFYEFTERRQKLELAYECKTEKWNFMQFGGDVTITYNPYVPLFNMEEIKTFFGKSVFSLETSGCLSSSEDKSFSDYKGMLFLPKDKKRTFEVKNTSPVKAEFGKQKITLDSSWQQGMENLWLLGDNAILTLGNFSKPDSVKDADFFALMQKNLTQGTMHSYALWKLKTVTSSKNQLSVMNVFYQPQVQNVTRDFQILTKCRDGSYAFVKLTVFDGAYQSNRRYFDSILNSYIAE